MERTSPGTKRGTAIERLWEQEPEFRLILAESASLEGARDRALAYLDGIERDYRTAVRGGVDLDRLQQAAALSALRVLRGMFSAQNEACAGFSTLDLLRRTARGDGEDEVERGFVEEFRHLFARMRGRSGLSGPRFARRAIEASKKRGTDGSTGRRAAVMRSRFLDDLATEALAEMEGFPSGLDRTVIERRAENRERILSHLGGERRDWDDPSWQMANVLWGEAGLAALRTLVPLTGEELAAVHLSVRHRLPWGITPYYLSLFDFRTAERVEDGQVRSQVIPPLHTARAMVEHRKDRATAFDFMRERDTSPADRITRRYPMVAILKVCDTCPQICAYCQRNWEISDAMAAEGIPSREDLERALDWFERHDKVGDVLLTGGDPLVLDDGRIAFMFERLARMKHIKHVRIGTRVPVTMPMRVTEGFARMIAEFVDPGRREVSVMTHVESVYEITPELVSACDRLRAHGVRTYNQQVFTVETSRRFQTAANRVGLKRIGIDPYYTFYTKGKDEHRDYLVPLARLLQERKEEARLLPGMFRTDESVFNVPGLGKHHLRARQDREWIAVDRAGRRVYLFHPWEKGIAPVAPWKYVDTDILGYLRRLETLGEDPSDYESIWDYD
jgi:lysine 2,3-aminomutase